jgi:hypothetical protein
MRLSTVFQVSFVGALMFSPAMAEDVDKVHEEALKILRGQSTNAPAKPTPAPSVAAPASQSDRDAQRRQQAADAEIRRQQQQEERRRKFEQEVQQRELQRQQQRDRAPGTAPQAGTKPTALSPEEAHQKALEILHNSQATTPPASPVPAAAQPAPVVAEPAPVQPTPAQPVPAPIVRPAPAAVAPQAQPPADIQDRAREILRQQQAEMQRTPSTAQFAAPRERSLTAEPTADEEAMHQKALEILHGGQPQSNPTTAATVAPTIVPAPAQPATLQNLQPAPAFQPQSAPTTVTTSSPPAGDAEAVHQRALEILRQQEGASVQPAARQALDPRTQEMLRRQNQELTREAGTPPSSSVPPISSTPVSNIAAMPQHELAPEMEARAREILRQQEASAAISPAAQPSDVPATAPATTPAVSPAPATATPEIQYSKELENKARQALLERAQGQQPAQPNNTAAASVTTASSNVSTAAAAPSTTPPANNTAGSPMNTASDADIAAVHAKALDVMEHARNPSGTELAGSVLGAQKPKREKLQELTDLYKADKLTPAQYHEARAKILAQPQ